MKRKSESARLREMISWSQDHTEDTGERYPSRQRKEAKRFEPKTDQTASTELDIKKGRGVVLGDVPAVVAGLKLYDRKDPFLKKIHSLLYSRTAKWTVVKSNIKKFSGYTKKEESAKADTKLTSWSMNDLRKIADVFGVHRAANKTDIVVDLVKFLKKPTANAATVKSSPKKATAGTKRKRTESGSSKKKTDGPKKGKNGYMFYASERRPELAEEQPDARVTELSKIIGAEWREMTTKEKKPYQDMADDDKKRYERELKAWNKKGGKKAAATTPPKKKRKTGSAKASPKKKASPRKSPGKKKSRK